MSNPLIEGTPPTIRPTVSYALSVWRTPLGLFILFAVVLTALFAKWLGHLVVYVAASNLHSYILLVPIVSAYLFYDRRSRLPGSYKSSPLLALTSLLVGLTALLLARIASRLAAEDYLTFVALSFVCLLAAAGF